MPRTLSQFGHKISPPVSRSGALSEPIRNVPCLTQEEMSPFRGWVLGVVSVRRRGTQ